MFREMVKGSSTMSNVQPNSTKKERVLLQQVMLTTQELQDPFLGKRGSF